MRVDLGKFYFDAVVFPFLSGGLPFGDACAFKIIVEVVFKVTSV